MQDLIDIFSIERIGKSGAKFDIEKAKWFNQHYLRKMPVEELAGNYQARLAKEGITCENYRAVAITALMKERVTFPDEIWTEAKYFNIPPDQYDQKFVYKKLTPDVVRLLKAFNKEMLKLEQVTAR